jgi:hypothetical protein
MPRAMQDANDLNAVWDNPVQDQVREFNQGTGLGCYIRPSKASLGNPPQDFHLGFEPDVKLVRRGRIGLAGFKPDIDEIAARAGGITDRGHPLSFRFVGRLLALGGAAQFGEIQLAGIAAVETFAPGAPQALEALGFLLIGAFEQAHHLAGRGVAAGVDLAFDEADELGRQRDGDVHALPSLY